MEDPGGRTCPYNHISAFMIMATLCMYVRTYGSHVGMYVCMYVCMYVHTCIITCRRGFLVSMF